MKKATLVAFAVLCSTTAFADDSQYHLLETSRFDVVAPSVPGTASVSAPQVGMIVYDASSDQFKGLNSSGNWDAMTAPNAGNLVTSGGAMRIESARINSSCSSVASASSNWISSLNSPATGKCDLTLNSTFSSQPVCTLTFDDPSFSGGAARVCYTDSANSDSTHIKTRCKSTDTTDSTVGFNIVCIGPR